MMRDAPDVTILTGAAGWLGTALTTSLAHGDHRRTGRIRALVHHADDVIGVEAAVAGSDITVDCCVGDIADPRTARRLFDLPRRGTTVVDVLHTAGVIHPSSVAEFDAVNAQGTQHVLSAAEELGVRRFVHVSSNSPFGTNPDSADRFGRDEPFHPYYGYGRSKMDAELAVQDAVARGLDAVVVRPPWFYGPHQPARQTTFFTMVRTGRFPVLGGGGQQRSMVYIDNLVDGVVLAELTPTEPGRGWWIADARPYSINEIVATVGEALSDEGYEVRPNRLRLPGVVGSLAERADALLQGLGRYNQQVHVLGELDKNIAVDITAARTELGYMPSVDLAEGMRRSIRWCREQGIEL